jgi:hypothetical protein
MFLLCTQVRSKIKKISAESSNSCNSKGAIGDGSKALACLEIYSWKWLWLLFKMKIVPVLHLVSALELDRGKGCIACMGSYCCRQKGTLGSAKICPWKGLPMGVNDGIVLRLLSRENVVEWVNLTPRWTITISETTTIFFYVLWGICILYAPPALCFRKVNLTWETLHFTVLT